MQFAALKWSNAVVTDGSKHPTPNLCSPPFSYRPSSYHMPHMSLSIFRHRPKFHLIYRCSMHYWLSMFGKHNYKFHTWETQQWITLQLERIGASTNICIVMYVIWMSRIIQMSSPTEFKLGLVRRPCHTDDSIRLLSLLSKNLKWCRKNDVNHHNHWRILETKMKAKVPA